MNIRNREVKVCKGDLDISGPSLTAGNKVYKLNGLPSSYDMEHFWIEAAFMLNGDDIKLIKNGAVKLPPVLGFPMMLVQPRQAVAILGDTIAVADPCFENIYYYDLAGKLTSSFRMDSLLGISGSCAKFKTFRQDKKVPQRNFDELMNINSKGRILRSIDNYKGRLLVRVATSYHDCDTYVIDPISLEYEKIEITSVARAFATENIPIDNFTVIDGDYIINTIQSDIKDLDLSRFKNHEEFKQYTEKNKNTGTSYLVREIIFE